MQVGKLKCKNESRERSGDEVGLHQEEDMKIVFDCIALENN